MVHDVCLQNLDVTLVLDRAGIVGADGATHQGFYDLAYLRALPNIAIMAPKDENELRHMMRTAIEGLPVRQAMITDFNPLHPWDTLDEAVRLLLAGAEQDFAVVDDGKVIGVLTRKRLMKALAEGDRMIRVQHAMEKACQPVGEGEMLDGAFRRMQEEECALLPVVRDGRLVGLLTAENVGELVMVATSLRKQAGVSDVRGLLASMRSS